MNENKTSLKGISADELVKRFLEDEKIYDALRAQFSESAEGDYTALLKSLDSKNPPLLGTTPVQ